MRSVDHHLHMPLEELEGAIKEVKGNIPFGMDHEVLIDACAILVKVLAQKSDGTLGRVLGLLPRLPASTAMWGEGSHISQGRGETLTADAPLSPFLA